MDENLDNFDANIEPSSELLENDNSINEYSDTENQGLNELSKYYDSHGYGPEDYDIYSKDPEWRDMMSKTFPDVELPSLNENFENMDSEGQALDKFNDYYATNGYGPEDYDTYSQDPEWRDMMSKTYPDVELPPLNNIEPASNDSASEVNELSEWLGDINPNFDPYDIESPYCNNCGSCAYAVYRRLEGDTEICATAENIGYNDEMTALTGMEQVSMSPEEIQNNLLEQGEGAHAIIGIDRAEGPGHWFNAICKDGKVYAIDGQTGEIADWPPDYGDVVNWEMSVKKEDM